MNNNNLENKKTDDRRQTTDDNKEEKKISDECHKKCAEIEKKYKRALADYQNLLKRTAAEKEEFVKYANERLLHEILPVYDNLKMSLAHAGDEVEKNGWLEGIKYVVKQFSDALKNIGVEEVKTIGEKFDPNKMEAVEKKETDDEEKDGNVESEIMAGYMLGERVLRAARVVVFEHITHNT